MIKKVFHKPRKKLVKKTKVLKSLKTKKFDMQSRLVKALAIMFIISLTALITSCSSNKQEELTATKALETQRNASQQEMGNQKNQTLTQTLTPEQACIQLCLKAKQQGLDLSNGPCLSDFMEWNVEDYVCDVAHWPRQPVDNKRENQCNAWHSGKAHHFVEVDPECNFIRKV